MTYTHPLLIGISGKAHTGKDTIADYLVEIYRFHKLAYANELKSIIHEYYNIPKDQLWTNQKSIEVRRLLQGTGQLIKNFKGNNYWTNIIDNQISLHMNIPIVISDVRFTQESDQIFARGGSIIRIERPNRLQIETGHTTPSEIELDTQTHMFNIIENTGTIKELYQKVDEILKNTKPLLKIHPKYIKELQS